MPKRNQLTIVEFEQVLMQPGHRWKNRGQMLSVFICGGVFGDKFNSTRNALIYAMYKSNWLDISPDRPHKTITIEEISNKLDEYIPDIIDNELVYKFFGTSRNTFKNKYQKFLNLPKYPTMGDVIIAMDKWTDKKWQILHPIKQKHIAMLPGMHHKKLSYQIKHIPQLQEFLKISNLTYSEIRGFPPYLVENYFEEIGMPEKYVELVEIIEIIH
ncbi:hypothetical protein [Psychroserpens damuponensis]|uniref:hypothetical protein n=1 Tax=Psychroserpens damuponensis TaxID=943936 RepID=UPI00126996F5|nr:hypothetical protein [Psychroserpens damuponensis]